MPRISVGEFCAPKGRPACVPGPERAFGQSGPNVRTFGKSVIRGVGPFVAPPAPRVIGGVRGGRSPDLLVELNGAELSLVGTFDTGVHTYAWIGDFTGFALQTFVMK